MDIQAFGNRVFGSLRGTQNIDYFSKSPQSLYVFPLIAGILGIAIVAIIVFIVFRYKVFGGTTVRKNPINLFNPESPVVVSREIVRKTFLNTYTLSFYIKIDAVPDMRISATPALTWPGIWDLNYYAAKEELVWSFMPVGNTHPTKIIVPSVPLQRWMQIALTFEGRTVDMYVNGKLLSSTTLENLPPIPNASITIVPKQMIGKLAFIQAWSRRLMVREIADNYVATSDSQGRPLLDPDFLSPFKTLTLPTFFCLTEDCQNKPSAAPSQTWEFPYA